MSEILFSICTPSVRLRFTSHLLPLIDKIGMQMYGKPVEHLVLYDNKRRTIGGKRQALLDIAQGRYIAFIDDDDDVADDYVDELLKGIESGADVITFKQDVFINKVGPYPLTFKMGHSVNEEPDLNGFIRPPWHVCAWRAGIAKVCRFSDRNYGEDWDWCEAANSMVETAHHIDLVLCTYHYDETVSEAKL